MNLKTEHIIDTITKQMGHHADHFEITEDLILVEEKDQYAVSIRFTPKPFESPEAKVVGFPHCLEFQRNDGEEPVLILGEDTEMEINSANIFAQLYFGEIVEEPNPFPDREYRYCVLKTDDIHRYLGEDQIDNITQLSVQIDQMREKDGKKPLSCLVIEEDWPEYPKAAGMLQRRIASTDMPKGG